MIHVTLAIAAFMEMLVNAMLLAGARFAGVALAGAGLVAGPVWLIRRRRAARLRLRKDERPTGS